MCASDRRSPGRGLRFTQHLLAALFAFATLCAQAQSDKDAEQVKRLRLQMRQVQQQQQEAQEAQAKADQARQQAEASLKAQEGELNKQRGAASSASRRASALSKELEGIKAQHQAALAELTALKAQHQALLASSKAAQLSATDNDKRLRDEIQKLSADLQRSHADNLSLSELGLELLQRYEDKGLGEVLSANEPFVQSGRVRLENLKADYTRRIDAARADRRKP